MIHKDCFTYKPVAIIAGMLCLWLCTAADVHAVNASVYNREGINPAEGQAPNSFLEPAVDFPIYLYFVDPANKYLLGEERPGLGSDDQIEFCRQIVNALIRGPFSSLARTIPAATELRAIYIDGKTVYVDLSGEVASLHPGGIRSELMTIYSIVNTLVLNVDGVDQVKILIAGQEAETLSGHIDIRFPLNADMLLIR